MTETISIGDGLCDAGDPDDDNDNVADGDDNDPFNRERLSRSRQPTACDDCSSGTDDAERMTETISTGDGLCDAGDPDDDNDNVPMTPTMQ